MEEKGLWLKRNILKPDCAELQSHTQRASLSHTLQNTIHNVSTGLSDTEAVVAN